MLAKNQNVHKVIYSTLLRTVLKALFISWSKLIGSVYLLFAIAAGINIGYNSINYLNDSELWLLFITYGVVNAIIVSLLLNFRSKE